MDLSFKILREQNITVLHHGVGISKPELDYASRKLVVTSRKAPFACKDKGFTLASSFLA